MALYLGPKSAGGSQGVVPDRPLAKLWRCRIEGSDDQLVLPRSIHHGKHVIRRSQATDFLSLTKKRNIAGMPVGIADQPTEHLEPNDGLTGGLINSFLANQGLGRFRPG